MKRGYKTDRSHLNSPSPAHRKCVHFVGRNGDTVRRQLDRKTHRQVWPAFQEFAYGGPVTLYGEEEEECPHSTAKN